MKLLLSITLVGALAAPAVSQTRVIDGDTLVHNGERIRIWGLDCAERGTQAGDAATRLARSIIEGNKIFVTDRAGKSYNRTVARVLVQRTSRAEFFTFDFACYMIQQGACREWTRFSNGFYKRCAP